jgi:hypothetical protein
MQDPRSADEVSPPAPVDLPFNGLSRVRRVVLDTGPLTTDVIGAIRRREPSPLSLAMQFGIVRGYAAHHVWAEVPRVLAKRAQQAGLQTLAVEHLWWDHYVPLIHFVDCQGLPPTEQSRALARRDPTDAATLVLAGLLAPTVVIAEDHDILASGLAYEQWTRFYDVARTLNSGHSGLQLTELLASLGVRGVAASARTVAKLGGSPALAALTSAGILALAAAAYRKRAELRMALQRAGEARREIMQSFGTTFVAFSERLLDAEATWRTAERGPDQSALLNRVAVVLATAEAPRTRTEIVSALDLSPQRRRMSEVAHVLGGYPAFVQQTQYRWQLGRDGMDFGGFAQSGHAAARNWRTQLG